MDIDNLVKLVKLEQVPRLLKHPYHSVCTADHLLRDTLCIRIQINNVELKLEPCYYSCLSIETGYNNAQILLLWRDYRNVVIRSMVTIWLLCYAWCREL